MASQTAQPTPFARLTRGGFGFSSRHDTKKKATEDDEWYIPYNGPYELPRDLPRREKARDSWGDVLEEFDDDGVLGDRELQIRYGGDFRSQLSNGRYVEEERKGRSRDRSFSVHSTRTTSSGAMDPGRGSLTMNRRSTVSSPNPPPLPSFANIDALGGGVGESPVPHLKNSKDTHRISIASIFSFNSHRKSVASPTPERTRATTSKGKLQRGSSQLQEQHKGHVQLESPPHVNSSSHSKQKIESKQNKHQRLRDQVTTQDDRIDSTVTEDDYYNTYYQSLVQQSDHDRTRLLSPTYQPRSPTASSDSRSSSNTQRDNSSMSRQNSTSINSGHPYAYAFPSAELSPPPQTAPPSSTPYSTFNSTKPPKLTFTSAGAGPSSSRHPAYSPDRAVSPGLKNSISTPNLRSPIPSSSSRATTESSKSNITPPAAAPKFVFPKGKERWLSAETWCDALLFPRPRLRLKQEILPAPNATPVAVSTGRIVSPPVTPTEQRDFDTQQQREPGIASRVLAHSRSLVDLSLNKGKKKEAVVPQRSILQDSQTAKTTTGSPLRPPRPKSFAWDDLALPSPVPSLAHVLREGALLDSERKAWQRQAQNSFGNKGSRSASRTRAKSLTQKGRKHGHQHQSSMEFLAAQACLGTQNYSPGIAPPRLAYFADGTNSATSRGTHSHSNSLVKTLTKSSKSHSRTHSRNDSWSKSAMKSAVAKPAVLAGFSTSDAVASSSSNTPHYHRGADLEGALKGHGTRVIRLADPAHIPLDRGASTLPIAGSSTNHATQRKTPSPAFSAISDSKVGIALGTPPGEVLDTGVSYIPSHPYAQGGLSFNAAPPADQQWHPDFAGPHPSVNPSAKEPNVSDVLTRHRLPLHPALHPYAQVSNRDSYLEANGFLAKFRSNDNTPHESKMWAQLSPSGGIIQEVLPGDLQYSPFSPETSRLPHTPNRNTLNIRDTVGLGETLVNAVNANRFRRASPDSGVGTSESHGHNPQYNAQQQQRQQSIVQASWNKSEKEEMLEFEEKMRRKDTFNSPPRIETQMSPGPIIHTKFVPNHTFASSNSDFLPVPSPEQPSRHPSPGMTSESSSQNSPLPLGSPNDLENFQDLFYRPPTELAQRTPNEAALPESPSNALRSSIPWDMSMRSRRTDSGLTNLARQLSDEFEQMGLERERSSGQYSGSISSSLRQQSSLMRRPTEGSLQFVFEELPLSSSPPEDRLDDTIQAFKATETLPEDVYSSRASSFIENNDDEDDDPTAKFRVGVVESVSTPPAISTEHHLSFMGQTAFVDHSHDVQQHGLPSANSHDSQSRIISGLQAPLTDATRSSYATVSTFSRMSNLSDFPAPPKDDNHVAPKHMSLLSSYFNEAMSQSDSVTKSPPAIPTLLEEDRVTFGGNQNADDLAKTLSSSQPEPF